MDHVHYDLDRVEAGIRHMFATVPADHIAEAPEAVAAFRRAADVEVALTRWYLSEIMYGTSASHTMDALMPLFTNLFLNRISAFSVDPGDPPLISQALPDLIERITIAYQNKEKNGLSENSFPINPVMSGRA